MNKEADKSTSTSPADDGEVNNTGARVAAAGLVGLLGFKKGAILGFPADVMANAYKGEDLTFGQKFRGLFKMETYSKYVGAIMADLKLPQGATQMEVIQETVRATSKASKYGIIASFATAGAGALLGWIRGDRIGSSKEIATHPWRSLMVVVGLHEPTNPKYQKHHATTQKAKDAPPHCKCP